MKKHDFKGIRKLSAIVTLALVLTIGGVFATFSYATQTVESNNQDVAMSLATITSPTLKGTLSVGAPAIKFDDAGFLGENKIHNYKVGLSIPAIQVSFSPAANGVSEDVRANGIKLKMKITLDDTKNSYDGHNVFVLKNLDENGEVLLKDGNPVKEAIDVLLTNYIGITDFSLPTIEDYNRFKTEFVSNANTAGVIKITVSEYVEPAVGA